ncbi:MAG: hypothetical protein ACRDU5_21485 [Mycobacterium sp.]
MSECISRHGEFSSHTRTDDQLVCDLCGVFDEDGARQRIAELEARVDVVGEVRKLEPKPGDVLVVRADGVGPEQVPELAAHIRDLVGEHVAVLFVAPDASVELVERHVAAAALASFADTIDSWPADGPRLPPSVFSAMARERAADLRGDGG